MKPIRVLRAVALALAFLSTAICRAQPATQPSTQPATRPARVFGNGAGGRSEIFLQRFRDATADLGLTDDQKTKIEAIFTSASDNMRALAPQLQAMDRQDRQQKFRELILAVREQIRSVLTDEQMQKLQEKLQTTRGPGAGVFGAGAGQQPAQPPASADGGAASAQIAPGIQQALKRLEDSLATLQLSTDQKKQVQSIVDEGKKQIADMRDKVQAGTMTLEESRAGAPRVLESMRDQLAGVLSADQQTKLRDAIQSRFDQQQNGAPAATPPPSTQPTMKTGL